MAERIKQCEKQALEEPWFSARIERSRQIALIKMSESRMKQYFAEKANNTESIVMQCYNGRSDRWLS